MRYIKLTDGTTASGEKANAMTLFQRGLLVGAIGIVAVALVLGGAVFGGSLEITRSAPAYADAVQVQADTIKSAIRLR